MNNIHTAFIFVDNNFKSIFWIQWVFLSFFQRKFRLNYLLRRIKKLSIFTTIIYICSNSLNKN